MLLQLSYDEVQMLEFIAENGSANIIAPPCRTRRHIYALCRLGLISFNIEIDRGAGVICFVLPCITEKGRAALAEYLLEQM